jgi:hypothetical protein
MAKKVNPLLVTDLQVLMAIGSVSKARQQLILSVGGYDITEKERQERLIVRLSLILQKKPNNSAVAKELNEALIAYDKKFGNILRAEI